MLNGESLGLYEEKCSERGRVASRRRRKFRNPSNGYAGKRGVWKNLTGGFRDVDKICLSEDYTHSFGGELECDLVLTFPLTRRPKYFEWKRRPEGNKTFVKSHLDFKSALAKVVNNERCQDNFHNLSWKYRQKLRDAQSSRDSLRDGKIVKTVYFKRHK